MKQPTLFESVLPLAPARTIHRAADPVTSELAAKQHRSRHTNAAAMLAAYTGGPLTDVEAAAIAGLERVEATRRASDLRNRKLIEPLHEDDGTLMTKLLPSGRLGMVCAITAAGRAAHAPGAAA